jgi:hypothetical protein
MSQTRNLSVYSAACALEESLAALAAQVLLRLYCKALLRLYEGSIVWLH